MNTKKANWLFLIIVSIHCIITLGLGLFRPVISLNIIGNLIISEAMLIIPTILFLLFRKREESISELLGFRKVKISTVGMTVICTFLLMPITTLVNAISMLFVDNTVMLMSEDILSVPFIITFFLIAIYGPVCEEVVFRGAVYGGYRKDGRTIGGIVLSGILFGLIHMNLNQAGYAVIIGIALAFLLEASGSIWPAIICHVIFNAQSVITMYVYDLWFPGLLEQESANLTNEMIWTTISGYIVIAAVATAIVGCIIVWIAKNENQTLPVGWKWGTEKKRLTIPLIIGVIIAVGYIWLTI